MLGSAAVGSPVSVTFGSFSNGVPTDSIDTFQLSASEGLSLFSQGKGFSCSEGVVAIQSTGVLDIQSDSISLQSEQLTWNGKPLTSSFNHDRNSELPLGTVIDWWCPPNQHVATRIPSGYSVCDGSIVTDQDSPYFRMILPDLRGAFSWGAINTLDVGNVGLMEDSFLQDLSGGVPPTVSEKLSPTFSDYSRRQQQVVGDYHQSPIPSAPPFYEMKSAVGDERSSSIYPSLPQRSSVRCVRLMKLIKIK